MKDNTPINLDRIFKAHLVLREDVAQGVIKLTFQTDRPFSFLPWQYVWLEIPNLPVPDPHGSRRAFSIFNPPDGSNKVEIVARVGSTGYKQSLFLLNQGAEVIIHGPFGSSFMVDEKSDRDIVMIAGGVGIAAFICLIKTIKGFPHPQRCFLVYLNKDPERTPFLADLEKLKSENSYFDYQVIYGLFTWDLVSGKLSSLTSNPRWMIAGPQGLIDDVSGKLEIAGIPKNLMEFENYYPTSKNNLTRADIEGQINSNNLFYSALQISTNHSIITDTNGVVLFANKAAQQITGYSESEMLGNTPRLWGGMMSHEFYVNFWKNKSLGIDTIQEIINRRKNGQIYYTLAHISALRGNNGDIVGYIGTEEDISHIVETKKILEEKILELERLNKSMVGRELKMLELKSEIAALKSQPVTPPPKS